MTKNSKFLTIQQKIEAAKASTKLTSKEVLKMAEAQGNLMKKNELSWYRELIRYLPTKTKNFCTMDFLKTVKNKKRRSHKKQAKFYLDLFEYLGCNYRK